MQDNGRILKIIWSKYRCAQFYTFNTSSFIMVVNSNHDFPFMLCLIIKVYYLVYFIVIMYLRISETIETM